MTKQTSIYNFKEIHIKKEQYIEPNLHNKAETDVYYILKVQNISKLASFARDYEKWSFELNCLKEHLCSHVYRKTTYIMETIPTEIVYSFEYLTMLVQEVIRNTIQNYSNKNIILVLVSDELVQDSMMKSFIPFTQINKVQKYEKAIYNLLSEIAQCILDKHINSFILYPLDSNQKKQTKFKEILRIAK